jgi:hypothetical protein
MGWARLIDGVKCETHGHGVKRRHAGTWGILGAKVKAIEREEGMANAVCSPILATEKVGMARKIFWRWSYRGCWKVVLANNNQF